MMTRPKQTKVRPASDNDDLLEASGAALEHIADAMEELRGIEEFVDIFGGLEDIWDELMDQYKEYDAIATAEYREEMDGLLRQYYRSVL